MKRTIMIIVALVSTMLFQTILNAQNIDHQRMERDINIMEKVLGELFKTEWNSGPGQNILHIAPGSFSFGGSTKISGSYLPDYGIIFMIPSQSSGNVITINGDQQQYEFQYSDEGNDARITEDTVRDRIEDFLIDYGPTIGQLNDNNRITVIYGSRGSGRNSVQVFTGNEDKTESNKLPEIKVTARKNDLERYRTGDINKDQLRSRLKVSPISADDNDNRRLNIMSKILVTAFDDDISDNFELDDNLTPFYLEGFGAIFQGEASYGSGFFGLGFTVSRIRNKLTRLSATDSISLALNNQAKSISGGNDDEELAKNLKEAYNEFVSALKQTIIDYGHTLPSVQADEHILVSLSLSPSSDEIPDRIDLQVKKSVLERANRGQISRNQAMDEIAVREY